MKNRRNFYRTLHVQPDAPVEVIRISFRTIMQKLKAHPDLGGDERQARYLNEAYATLSDPDKRRRYDQQIRPWNRGRAAQGRESRGGEPAPAARPKASKASRGRRNYRCSYCGTVNFFESLLSASAVCSRCRTPLTTAAGGNGKSCKRQVRRLPQSGSIRFFSTCGTRAYSGDIRDLSPRGIRFQSSIPLRRGITVRIESPTINAVARIANCCRSTTDPGQFEIGASFSRIQSSFLAGTFVSDVI